MKRFSAIIALMLVLIAAWPASAQSAAPQITSFTTPWANVGREALLARSARVPVSWTSANRPITANLVFEQVLPDGSTINVELPRSISYVASNGDGIAAPIMPPGNATNIVLRVSLVNIFNSTVYDTQQIILPIVTGGNDNGGNTGGIPTITSFFATVNGAVSQQALNDGSARIPVSWTSINRPVTANLVFEQILADGRVINVELPRDFQWVNSSDSGLVAPQAPGGNATSITLRVRLIDLLFNRTYDQRYLSVPIGTTQPPRIDRFLTTTTSITRAALDSASGVTIDVQWNVANRPPNTNLVFEQILPDGRVRNAELPRDVFIVPSSGVGAVRLLSVGNASYARVQMRLYNLSNNGTLASATFDVNVTGNPVVTVDSFTVSPSSIPADDYDSSSLDIEWTTSNATNVEISVGGVKFSNIGLDGNLQVALSSIPNSGSSLPVFITAMNANGISDIETRNIAITTADAPVIDYVRVEPSTAKPGDTVTISWALRGQFDSVNLTSTVTSDALDRAEMFSSVSTSGQTSFQIAAEEKASSIDFTLTVLYQGNQRLSETATLTIEQPDDPQAPTIDSFTATPTTVKPGESVQLSWSVTGSFDSLGIASSLVQDEALVAPLARSIPQTTSGQTTVVIPASTSATRVDFNLNLTYQQNLTVLETISVEIDQSAPQDLAITSFTASPQNPNIGGEVTFTWEITGDLQSASIQAADDGQLFVTSITEQSGTAISTLPSNREGAQRFNLVATDTLGNTVTESVDVQIACGFAWNIENDATTCPSGPLIAQNGASQRFERGFMVWSPGEGDSMWVFFDNGSFLRFPDNWDGSAYDIAGDPPAGLLEPERGFGYLWNTVPSVRSGLGYASDTEQPYIAQRQATVSSNGTIWYLEIPQNGTATLKLNMSDGTWVTIAE